MILGLPNETDPIHIGFTFLEKLGKTSFKNTSKHLDQGDGSISPPIRATCFYLKQDLFRNVLSTTPFFRDIYWLRYLKNNIELLVNLYFSVYFEICFNLDVRGKN